MEVRLRKETLRTETAKPFNPKLSPVNEFSFPRERERKRGTGRVRENPFSSGLDLRNPGLE